MPFLPRSTVARMTLVASSLLGAAAAFAAPSTTLSVDGAVAVPSTYNLTRLQALAASTQTDGFLSGTTPQTHVYTGTSLWGILNTAGININASVKNDVLNKYVLATGTDGYRTVFSLGELNPSFGNRQDLVAYAETLGGVSSPLTSDGFARITAPGDAKGGRYVSNLAELTVRSSGSTQAGTGGGTSSSFAVSGAVKTSISFDIGELAALPVTTETVGTHVYTGVSFWDFLNSTVGIAVDPSVKNDVLDKYVVATGSDGYKSLFSLGELDTDFGDQPDLIAYSVDGQSLGTDGFARIVVPNDIKAGRWVSNLVSLEVFTAAAIPEPQTYALMLAGLVAVGLASKRRQRVDPAGR